MDKVFLILSVISVIAMLYCWAENKTQEAILFGFIALMLKQ
jgi:hypothetical protein